MAAPATIPWFLECDDLGRRRYQKPPVRRRDDVARPYWYVRVRRHEGPTGKRTQERIFLGYCDETSQRKAEQARDGHLGKVNSPNAAMGQITLRQFIEIYYRPQHVETLAVTSQRKYESHLARLLKRFGDKPLSALTTRLLQAWFNTELRSLAPETRHDLRNRLSGIFTKAIAWELHHANPAKAISLERKRGVREKVYLTDQQVAALVSILPARVALVVEVLTMTGCRISEILGLQERHISIAENGHGWARIEQAYSRGELADATKSDRGERMVPLLGLVNRLELTGNSRRFVFERRPGEPWDDRELAKIIRRSAKALGFWREGVGMHSFRRKAVTDLQAAGATMAEVARMAGHSIKMTSHYTQSDLERMEALAQARADKGRVN
jgi:integrase